MSNTGDKTLRDVCSLKPTNKKRSVAAASEEPSNYISERLAKIFTLSNPEYEYENNRQEIACGESCVGASKCLCSKCHCCTLCSSTCTDCPSKVKKSPDDELGQLLGVEISSEEDTAAPQDSSEETSSESSGEESSGEPEEDDILEENNYLYIVSDDDDREMANIIV